MQTRPLLIFLLMSFTFPLVAQSGSEETKILRLVEDFFEALEKQDSITFRNMFVRDGYLHSIREAGDSVIVRSQLPSRFRFRQGQIVKERMRPATTTVKVEGRIAMVWAPYDLWINDTFSHCGVDVFTLVKTSKGWKISSIAYTMETQGCN